MRILLFTYCFTVLCLRVCVCVSVCVCFPVYYGSLWPEIEALID